MAGIKVSPKTFANRYRQNTGNLTRLATNLQTRSSPEDVHDLRVTVRRIQAICRLLTKETRSSNGFRKLDLATKSLFKSTNRVRDIDTLAKTLVNGVTPLPDGLESSLDKERQVAVSNAVHVAKVFSKSVIPRIDSSSINGKKLSRRLRRRIGRRAENIGGLLGKVLTDESKIEELHALRKEAKKLRYLLELADTKAPELDVLTRWQDILGTIHDFDVTMAYVLSGEWGFDKKGIQEELRRGRHASYLQFLERYRTDAAQALRDSSFLLPVRNLMS
jgi:CHAD domain-containing protein